MLKNSVLQKLDQNSMVIGLACNSLHPFRHIVHNNQDVHIAKGVWERSHEIDAPHVKNLNNQNGVEGHHISSRNTPKLLTTLTRCAVCLCVLEKGRPIESTLQNLCSSLLSIEMASTGMIMTKGDDIGWVMIIYTPLNDLIGPILEEIRLLLEKMLHHGQKFELILSLAM
jgi:hypothetical protein